jgi:glycosyltransferase involved in cell wall biosynthesis
VNLVVVIAAYNERDNIEHLTLRLVKVLRTLHGWNWEITYVIDGADGTKEIVQRVSADSLPISAVISSETRWLAKLSAVVSLSCRGTPIAF